MFQKTPKKVNNKFKVGLLPGSFNLLGATTEPLLAMTDGTNFDYPVLQYIDGSTTIWGSVTGLNAFFQIPSKLTANYTGGTIFVDIDFQLVGTMVSGATVVFGVGMLGVKEGGAFDIAPPISTSGTSWATKAYVLNTSETTLYKQTITVGLPADVSVAAGQHWIGRLARLTSVDTSAAGAYVTAITVYE